jgi:hypothetical protein
MEFVVLKGHGFSGAARGVGFSGFSRRVPANNPAGAKAL